MDDPFALNGLTLEVDFFSQRVENVFCIRNLIFLPFKLILLKLLIPSNIYVVQAKLISLKLTQEIGQLFQVFRGT